MPGRVVGTVELRGQAVCASTTNRRAWGTGLHHMLDGRTGVPVGDVVATWALADDAATADGVATALFFEPAAKLHVPFRFSSVRMFADGRIEPSTNFAGELFA
jgi:thiamine biosynthesis lipoprotein